jgi:opacity protein-like surface antigen
VKKYLGVLGILSALSFSSAVVAANPWTGVYGGIGLGCRSVELSFKDQQLNQMLNNMDIPSRLKGFSYGLELGGGAAVAEHLYLGLNLFFDFGKTKNKTKQGDVTKEVIGKNPLNSTLQIGVPFCNFMPFIELGYSTGEYKGKISEPLQGRPVEAKAATKGSGPIYGIGIKYMPMKNIVTSLGYRYTNLKTKKFEVSIQRGGAVEGVSVPLKSNLKSHAVVASVSYLFNF